MKWSKYCHMFQSQRNGWLLYSSASGAFLQLSDETAAVLQTAQKDPDNFDFNAMPGLYLTLRTMGILVEDRHDEDYYNILKMKRLTASYNPPCLALTIAITRSCNFGCSYCYEANRTGAPMSDETIDKLITFIDLHKKQKNLFITWYGGEPLLAMPQIRKIDSRLKELEKNYKAYMVTNGYLLTQDIIKDLNDLKITGMQITLDGSKETHDSRRCLLGGQGTFDRILANLDTLMASDYKGTVHIRVNVDMRNRSEFKDVYQQIRERYSEDFGKKISVYPGYVKGEGHPDASCFFDSNTTGQFVAELAREDGIRAMSLFPRTARYGCTLTKRNTYVVGPEGELYKCWDDVGIPELVIGHIDNLANWNNALIARGMVGSSYLDSPVCKECFYFPVCDGGCHKVRMRNLEDGGNRDCCSYFRDHLEELLELHYEQKMKQEPEQP